jgi:hypothetical protein
VSYHVPFACSKKSSPAFTADLPAARSRPNAPISAFGGGGAGGVAVAAAGLGTGADFCTAVEVHAARTSASAAKNESFMR